ncbi:APC family permease [Ferrimicrobium sp.]|uniref:APC family permease n=1 Tax=Ferrimicrobium sp. TaxID=2926050 RepID=UPI00261CA667|nr:APC family permease [Ferrimicrobium sp.]
MQGGDVQTGQQQTGRLRREMSYLDLSFAGLGAIIGSGWLFAVLYAAQTAGPAAIISWVLGGIACLFIALVYAELSGFLPEAGGATRYPQYSHGPLVGFIVSWAAFIAYASVPAIEAEAVVQYASHYIKGFGTTVNGSFNGKQPLDFIVEALLLVLFFVINIYGVKLYAKVNSFITFLKFLTPTLTILVVLFVAKDWSNYSAPATHGFAPYGTAGVLVAVSTAGIVFSFLGFRQAVEMAAEAKHPQRDAPRAILTALIAGMIVYVLLQVVFIAAIPKTELAHGWAGLSLTSPFAQVASALGLGWLATILYADAVLSPSGTGLVYFASTPRIILGSARNGYLGRVWRKISDKTGIPMYAMVATLIASAIFLLPFPTWESLVGVISSATVFTYIMGPVSLAVFRRHHGSAHRPYRLGGASVISPIAYVMGALIIYFSGWETVWKLTVGYAIGIVAYLIVSAARGDLAKINTKAWRQGTWLIAFIIVSLLETYFGSKRFGGQYDHLHGLIHYPWDLVVVVVVAIGFYYWGVASGSASQETNDAIERAGQLERPASSD